MNYYYSGVIIVNVKLLMDFFPYGKYFSSNGPQIFWRLSESSFLDYIFYYAAQESFKLRPLLLLPPQCWHYRWTFSFWQSSILEPTQVYYHVIRRHWGGVPAAYLTLFLLSCVTNKAPDQNVSFLWNLPSQGQVWWNNVGQEHWRARTMAIHF